MHVEWLPGYAPELNPSEQIWNHDKYTDLANFVPDDIQHLARRVGLSFHYQSRILICSGPTSRPLDSAYI